MNIPYGRHHINEEDIESVVDVLRNGNLTQGEKVDEFENYLAEMFQAKYAIAVSNGTTALHLSVESSWNQLNKKTEKLQKVITTPITFAASANCIEYCHGEVDFVDIDPKTFLIDLDLVEEKLKNSSPGEYSGIVPVDLAGHPIDIERLNSIAKEYNLFIVRDSCHAIGGKNKLSDGSFLPVGSGNFVDTTIFSFHPVKHIACGEGGAVLTNNKEIYEKVKLLRTHGITKNPEEFLNPPHGGWYYEMNSLGYNYRITDIQCALGLSQLKRLPENIKRRNEIARVYDAEFRDLPFETPEVLEGDGHAFHLYIIQTDKRDELYNYLIENQIYCQIHYIPVHTLGHFKKKQNWVLPNAMNYYQRCLTLPMYHSMTEAEQSFVIDKVKKFFQ